MTQKLLSPLSSSTSPKHPHCSLIPSTHTVLPQAYTHLSHEIHPPFISCNPFTPYLPRPKRLDLPIFHLCSPKSATHPLPSHTTETRRFLRYKFAKRHRAQPLPRTFDGYKSIRRESRLSERESYHRSRMKFRSPYPSWKSL